MCFKSGECKYCFSAGLSGAVNPLFARENVNTYVEHH